MGQWLQTAQELPTWRACPEKQPLVPSPNTFKQAQSAHMGTKGVVEL
jgi:hypothetical protein